MRVRMNESQSSYDAVSEGSIFRRPNTFEKSLFVADGSISMVAATVCSDSRVLQIGRH